jgi:hypothetical protein
VPDPDLDLESMSVYERGLALLWLRWEDVTVPAQRQALIELHRRRSVHAHVWDVDEFFPLLGYATRELGHAWTFVDGLLPGDPGGRPDEFGLVLRKDAVPAEPKDQAERLEAAWDVWRAYRGALRGELERLRQELQQATEDLAASTQANAELQARFERSTDELQRAASEGIGILHRLGQGRDLAPEEIRTVTRQAGGDAVPELIELLLRYRNHPFEAGARRLLGKAKRAVLTRRRA